MTIDEAIKILNIWEVEGEFGDSKLLDEAEKLAIEALKRIAYYREELQRLKILKVGLLPGETDETT